MVRTKTLGTSKPPNKKKALKGSGSSNPQRNEDEHVEVDPYYASDLQTLRFAQFQSRKSLSLRYVDTAWFTTEGFQFPSLLEKQGLNNFLELKGVIYPNLVREFYANFQYKDEICMSMIKGNLFCLDKDIFLQVGSLVCDGARIGDCSNRVWRRFEQNAMYVSCLRNPDQFVPGSAKKAGLMFVEDRIIHYLIVYMLVPRSTNLAQPTIRDLQLMYAIKRRIMLDWPSEILRNMHYIATSDKPLPLAYSIFISRIVDYLGIDTSSEVCEQVTKKDHLIDDGMLHKMNIRKFRNEWNYEDEEMEDAELPDSGNADDSVEEDQDDQAQNEATSSAPPAFGLAHLDAMEQRINARIQGVEDRMSARVDNVLEMEDRMYTRMEAMERNFHEALRIHTEDLRAEYTFASSVFTDLNPTSHPDPPQQP